ncbi:MAG: hypothetical protein Ct9H90mP13_00270 [Pseudomonadota bacterium]|nr:MAG: hypothetical protein Ct9H90mP13_00270 [Pseudomonadota bacterium]
MGQLNSFLPVTETMLLMGMDGKIDLFNSWDDVLMSIGNYLKQNGWDASKQI